MKKKKKKHNKKVKNHLKAYSKYTGIAFKMIFISLSVLFVCYKIDKYLCLKFPIFTVLGAVGGVVLSIYIVIREL